MTYDYFLLMLAPISSAPRAILYHSPLGLSWAEAAARIVASGATEGYQAGGYGKGRYMISVDSQEITRARERMTPVTL